MRSDRLRRWFGPPTPSRLRWLRRILLALTVGALVLGPVELGWQLSVQHGIDTHLVRVDATVVDYTVRHGGDVNTYTLAYAYGDRALRADLPLPGEAAMGSVVCLEIDATSATHARRCGTEGGLPQLRTDLALVYGVLAAVWLVMLVQWRRYGRGATA